MDYLTAWLRHLAFQVDRAIPDGEIHRVQRETPKRTAWYVAWEDPVPYAIAGDWRTGERWEFRNRERTDKEDAAWKKMKVERKLRRQRENELAELKALSLLKASTPARPDHPYLARKGILPCGALYIEGTLLLPMHALDGETYKLVGAQKIFPDGKKLFLSGQRSKGAFFQINPTVEKAVYTAYFCEGFATGATIAMATGAQVICAMSAQNIEPVLESFLPFIKPPDEIVIAGDNDHKTPGNPGASVARAVAKHFGVKVIVPEVKYGTDFNDLFLERGMEEVQRQLAIAALVGQA